MSMGSSTSVDAGGFETAQGQTQGIQTGDIPANASGLGAGSGGFMQQAMAFLQDPQNVQTLGKLLQDTGKQMHTFRQLPPQAQQFFNAASTGGMSGGRGPQGTQLGSMNTAGPALGDIPNYQISPDIARRALAGLGIPF